jgi:hypothetical protein
VVVALLAWTGGVPVVADDLRTTPGAIYKPVNNLAGVRQSQMVASGILASVPLGANEQINCSNYVRAFGSVGSFSAVDEGIDDGGLGRANADTSAIFEPALFRPCRWQPIGQQNPQRTRLALSFLNAAMDPGLLPV